MSKTIKVIDLLNKIANGEEVPKKIRYKDKIFIYANGTKKYYNENIDLFLEFYSGELLNDEVEVIEEQQDIDIQSIDKLRIEIDNNGIASKIINQLVQAVKQLDSEINNGGK